MSGCQLQKDHSGNFRSDFDSHLRGPAGMTDATLERASRKGLMKVRAPDFSPLLRYRELSPMHRSLLSSMRDFVAKCVVEWFTY